MLEPQLSNRVQGTRLIMGELAKVRRGVLNHCMAVAENHGFGEIVLPLLESSGVYAERSGKNVLRKLYVLHGEKETCLRKEGTATCQILAREALARSKNVQLWYKIRCWEPERLQQGLHSEFTQFGVEVLNPTHDYTECLISMAREIVEGFTDDYEVRTNVKCRAGYYDSNCFEVVCPHLDINQQLIYGGSYNEGQGFTVGVDRMMLLTPPNS